MLGRSTWPPEVLPYIRYVCTEKQEHLLCISLNAANEVLAIHPITVGLVDRVHIHPREVFAGAMADRATAIIIAHNHTCRDLTPSANDRAVTREIKRAGEIFGIQLLDHLVFNQNEHYSFLEHGELRSPAAGE